MKGCCSSSDITGIFQSGDGPFNMGTAIPGESKGSTGTGRRRGSKQLDGEHEIYFSGEGAFSK